MSLLDRKEAVLRRIEPGAWRVEAATGARAVPDTVVRAMVARDLLARKPGTEQEYILNDTGRALVRRLAASADSFRAQHRLAERRRISGAGGPRIEANAGETPLGWLARRKGPDGHPFLDRAEIQAGETLRADFTYAGLSPRVTQSWDALPRAGRGDPRPADDGPEARLAAKRRFHAALDAVGPGLSDVLVAVCCHLQGLEEAERGFGWPVRSGKVVLKIALGRLAAHYRLGPAGGGRPARAWRETG